MAQEANGKWPPNVTAVIITEEEKRARLAQAPPGGVPVVTQQQPQISGATPVPGAPYAQVETRYVIPNVTSNPVGQAMTDTHKSQQNDPSNPESNVQVVDSSNQAGINTFDEITGKAAIIAAQKMGVNVVWQTANRQPIDLASAMNMITQDPNSVYFDFDLVAELPEESDEVDEYSDADVMAQLPTPPPPRRQVQQAAPDLPHVSQQVQTQSDPVSDRERLAWGGVLSMPGQSVYFRQGVIRVEVEGKVVVQKGQKGNVRMLRVTRSEPGQSVQLANAVQTGVVPPLNQSPNPSVTYRQSMPQSEKIPVPRPVVKVPEVNATSDKDKVDLLDESEF